MNHAKLLLIMSVLAGCLVLVIACAEKKQETASQETQSEPPMELKTVVEKTTTLKPVIETTTAESDESLLKIKEAAGKEKEMLLAKKDELEKLLEQQSDTPVTAQLGEAQNIAQNISALKEQIQEHTDILNTYISQLKDGGIDISEFIME